MMTVENVSDDEDKEDEHSESHAIVVNTTNNVQIDEIFEVS